VIQEHLAQVSGAIKKLCQDDGDDDKWCKCLKNLSAALTEARVPSFRSEHSQVCTMLQRARWVPPEHRTTISDLMDGWQSGALSLVDLGDDPLSCPFINADL